jgi:hypothetical protein
VVVVFKALMPKIWKSELAAFAAKSTVCSRCDQYAVMILYTLVSNQLIESC